MMSPDGDDRIEYQTNECRMYVQDDIRPEQLRVALTAAVTNGLLAVLFLPPMTAARMLGIDIPETRQGPVDLDYDLKEYREIYAQQWSLSRIRELCAVGFFPDTMAQDGSAIPGAYKDSSGTWRITREGIRARQEEDRKAGLRQRTTKRVEVVEAPVAPGLEEANAPSSPPVTESPIAPLGTESTARSTPAGSHRQARPRPKQGAWRKARGVS